MGKLIFLLLLIVIAWAVVKHVVKSRSSSGQQKQPPAPEDMVRCSHCGVHLPRSESLTSDGRFFCSEDHLRLHG